MYQAQVQAGAAWPYSQYTYNQPAYQGYYGAPATAASEPLGPPGVAVSTPATTAAATSYYPQTQYANYYSQYYPNTAQGAAQAYAANPSAYYGSHASPAPAVAASGAAGALWRKTPSTAPSASPAVPSGSYNTVTYEAPYKPAYTAVSSKYSSSAANATATTTASIPNAAPAATAPTPPKEDPPAPKPPASQKSWPESLKQYVQRVFLSCPMSERSAAEKHLGEIVGKANSSNTLFSTDWDNMPLPPMCTQAEAKPEKKDVKFGIVKQVAKPLQPKVQLDGSETRSGSPSGISSPKVANGKRKRPLEDVPNGVADDTALGALPVNEKEEEIRRRESRANRFGATQVELPVTFGKKAKKAAASVRKNIAATLEVQIAEEVSEPGMVDWDKYAIVGTSQRLEKAYLRLTSAPDPSTVRPLHVLERTLELLKRKWSEDHDYTYICDQFKSLRQDLTVQRIKNAFTVQVYESHARIALERADLGEFNQCQTQLKHLYKEVKAGQINEFLAYRLLYQLHTRNRRDINTLLRELTPQQKEDPHIKHALGVRKAVSEGDYHTLFVLYNNTPPNMSANLMDHFVMRERLRALKVMCSAYKATNFTVQFAAEELGFLDADHDVDVESCWQLLVELAVPVTGSKGSAPAQPDAMDVDANLGSRLVDAKSAGVALAAKLQLLTKKVDIRGQI